MMQGLRENEKEDFGKEKDFDQSSLIAHLSSLRENKKFVCYRGGNVRKDGF